MEQSRVKSTSRNVVYAIIFQLVKIALVFITRIIFVKKLGAAYLGVNGLFSNILSVLSLADLGMTTALMYSLYKPLAENDEIKISEYMNYFKKVYIVIASIIAIVGIFLIPFLKYLVNLPSEMPHIYLYYILILLNSVVSYLFIYKTTLLSADQKMYVINKYDTIFQFIVFFLRLIILLFTNSFTLYLLIDVICTFTSNLLKVKKTEEIYPFLKNNTKYVLPKGERKKLYTNLYSLFFYRIGGVILNHTDNILISIFVGTITVGYYSNYATIIINITNFLSIVFTSLKASVGNYVISKDKDNQFKMFNMLELYNFWLVGFCAVCFIILIPDFITICFGKQYILGYAFLVVEVLEFYTSNIRQTLWIYRETTGLFTKSKYVTMVTAGLNIVFSIFLGYFFGLVGIVGATVLSRMIYAWWKEPIIIYKYHFKKSSKSYFINYIKRILLVTAICIILYLVCEIMPNFNIYVDFIIKIFICIITFPTIIILLYRKNNAFIYFKDNVLMKRIKGGFNETY